MFFGGMRMQNAKKAQRDNGQCLPDYATSPNHVYLKKTLGPSVIYYMPTGRPVGTSGGPKPPPFPTDRLTRSTLTNLRPNERSWTENQRRKSESVETTTAHAQNLYWTSTFLHFSWWYGIQTLPKLQSRSQSRLCPFPLRLHRIKQQVQPGRKRCLVPWVRGCPNCSS